MDDLSMDEEFYLSDQVKEYIDPIIADAIQDPTLYFEPEDFVPILAGELEEQGKIQQVSYSFTAALEMYLRRRMRISY